jgi:exopolysaccharide production protein ExoY
MFASPSHAPTETSMLVPPRRGGAAARAERVVDVAIALAALVFFAPLMLLVAGLVALSGQPVMYRQERIGRDGVLFSCRKFRTMQVNADQLLADLLMHDPMARFEWARDRKLRVDPRVTMLGQFLRKTSLDELPQLFNVLGGTMSIVGPRPIVPAEAARYGRYIADYCRVRPGITGLWQVSGRNGTSYRRRVACDVAYVRRKSLASDLWIIFNTIPAVCVARGAY